jgi:DNA-binding winged helix-turn-helix (wHTH) protein
LKVCIREIRRALGDDAHAPQFIETAHRRGYRFIAEVAQAGIPQSARSTPTADVVSVPHGPVQYARSGDVNIAYQVCGKGPVDLVFVMGFHTSSTSGRNLSLRGS